MKVSDWYGCYAKRWGDLIVDESYIHPAKYSRELIRRIYAHLIRSGYVTRGDTVLDPFGGVALGAFYALGNGLNWVGVELETDFVCVGRNNLHLWNRRWRDKLPLFTGFTALIQGDSVKLIETLELKGWVYPVWGDWSKMKNVLGSISACISSPPFGDSSGIVSASKFGGDGALKKWQANQANPKSNKVSLDAIKASLERDDRQKYAVSSSNLGKLPLGDIRTIASSPPYANGCSSNGGDTGVNRLKGTGRGIALGRRGGVKGPRYGDTDGNIANLPTGDIHIITSPPYEGSRISGRGNERASFNRSKDDVIYGQSNGQIGGKKASFWEASHQIVSQCHQLLSPGGTAVWVVKDFLRNNQVIHFCDMWQELCQSIGFTPVEMIRAWQVTENIRQTGLFGEEKSLSKSHKGFFRNLNESKGQPPIDYEVVWVMRKEG